MLHACIVYRLLLSILYVVYKPFVLYNIRDFNTHILHIRILLYRICVEVISGGDYNESGKAYASMSIH